MIFNELTSVATFVVESFLNLWPYLLLSVPLAVAVRLTDANQYIRRVFSARPVIAIILATAVGAFSPFCACTVVPIITSLLIAGVPLGPVMAFWIASPTMDPEIFLLSVGMLGPQLAIARMIATLILSISAGYGAHILEQRHFFSEGILRDQQQASDWSWKKLISGVTGRIAGQRSTPQPVFSNVSFVALDAIPVASGAGTLSISLSEPETACATGDQDDSCDSGCATGTNEATSPSPTLWQRVWQETVDATLLIVKFMLMAFVLEALITLYVPQEAIVGLLGDGNPLAILLASLIGVPVYTTNLTALPLVSGLLEQGMLPGAALAFLIAGPATTIPAMSAVFGIARARVFGLYVGVALVGAIVLGYGYEVLLAL